MQKRQVSESNFSIINTIIKDYEEKIRLNENMDAIKSVIDAFGDHLRISTLKAEYDKMNETYQNLPDVDEDSVQDHVHRMDQNFLMWLYYMSLNHFAKLFKEPKYEKLLQIIDIEEEGKRVSEFNRYIFDQNQFKDLLRVFPIIMTTNISAARLGHAEPSFDLAIIDEAGQCSIGYALFSIARARKLLLVGDLNQLKPVITLSHALNRRLMEQYKIPDVYNYINQSILGLMQLVDYVSPFVLLDYHYRSQKDIINFSNRKYYKNQLKIKTHELSRKALFVADSSTKANSKSKPEKNTSEMEAMMIAEDIKEKRVKRCWCYYAI